jgi:hypothetical protein
MSDMRVTELRAEEARLIEIAHVETVPHRVVTLSYERDRRAAFTPCAEGPRVCVPSALRFCVTNFQAEISTK